MSNCRSVSNLNAVGQCLFLGAMQIQPFDIVIPCFIPRQGWKDDLVSGLKDLTSETSGLRLQTVYLVNDGNPAEEIGEGIELLEENGFIAVQIDHNKNLGKGAAVRAGAEASTTPLLIYTDIDIPYRKEDVFRMAQAVHTGECDIAIAKRGESYYSSLSTFRRLLSRSFLGLNKMLFRLAEGDTQGGLKAMNANGKEALISTKIDRYLFDLEMVQIATRNKLRIKGFEVRLKDGVSLPGFNIRILVQELGNFTKLLFS